MEPVPAVVVGTDGSAVAARAVRFAAEEAARRGRPLTIVHVRDSEAADLVSAARLATAMGIARGYLDGCAIFPLEPIGTPAAALIAAARPEDLLVVGRGDVDGFGAVLGSVALEVVAHAECPVVTVAMTDPAAADPDAAHSAVVAGIKYFAQAEDILDTAFREAELRGCVLEVVHSWRHPPSDGHGDIRFPGYDPEIVTEEQTELLADTVRIYADKYPEVPVVLAAPHAGAVDALAIAAESAALVVVGAPHRSALRGLVLGSVGQALLRQISCPVVFVHPRRNP
jgi:nucleotide-binding universal stress UspA family protein